MKILIVDDEPILRKMYQVKFQNNGFEVDSAGDGAEVFDRLKESRPDIILLDVMMPKMDGFEVLARLKANQDLKNIPVVLLTNLSASELDKGKGMELGALDYLVKDNFTPADIVQKVKSYLTAIKP